MLHRIFIAINFPELLTKEIITVQQKLKKFALPVRWTSPENVHLTLRFLGSLGDEEVTQVKSIVKQVVKIAKPFSVHIDGFIVLPGFITPRVICLNVVDSEPLLDLQAKIAGAVEEQGIGESESHPFTGHLTIGRMEPVRVNFRALTQLQFKSSFEVKSVEVIESVLKPDWLVYSLVESHVLKHQEDLLVKNRKKL